MNIIQLRTVFRKEKRCNTYVSHKQLLEKHKRAREYKSSIRTKPRAALKPTNKATSRTKAYQHLKALILKIKAYTPDVQYFLLKTISEIFTVMLFVLFAGVPGMLLYFLMDDDE